MVFKWAVVTWHGEWFQWAPLSNKETGLYCAITKTPYRKISYTSESSQMKLFGKSGSIACKPRPRRACHLRYLSHTWVRYPGFAGHGVKCPILTTMVPGFSGNLIGCTIRSKWGPFGDLYLARKNLLCVWNKLFLGELNFSQSRTRPVKFLWWQIVPMQQSTNEWKNLIFFLIMGLAGTRW